MSSRHTWLSGLRGVLILSALMMALLVPLAAGALSTDGWEPDNTPADAAWFRPGTPVDGHSVFPAGDRDYFWFVAFAGQPYELRTGPSGGQNFDSYLYLYRSDGSLIVSNDDSAGNLWSLINWTAPATGVYYASVGGYSDSSVGDYRLSITGTSCGAVHGTVTEASLDRPVAGATVEAYLVGETPGTFGPTPYSATTDWQGHYDLAVLDPGNYVLRFSAGQLGVWYGGVAVPEDSAPLTIESNADYTADQVMDLGTSSIAGTVTEKDTGDPYPQADVSAYRYNTETSSYEFAGQTVTDAEGSYCFFGLADGAYTLAFSNPERIEFLGGGVSLFDADTVLVVGGQTALADYVLDDPDPSITGIITAAATGDPVISRVEAYAWEDGSWNFHGRVYTDENGRYELWGLQEGSYVLAVYSDEFGQRLYDDEISVDLATRVPVVPLETARADMALTEAVPSVQGTVMEAQTGLPVAAYVTAYRWNVESSSYEYANDTYTEEDGSYELWDLPDADYTLAFYNSEWDLAEYWGNTQDIEQAASFPVVWRQTFGADFQFDLPNPSIEGELKDESTGESISGWIELYQRDSDGFYNFYDYGYAEGGHYEFWGLPEGEYKLAFGADYYFTEFFDDKVSLNSADPITLTEGGWKRADAFLTPQGKLAPDQFEEDNYRQTASLMDPDGAPVVHTAYNPFSESGEYDEDWVKIPVTAGQLYTASAMPLVGEDIVVYTEAYDEDGLSLTEGWSASASFVAKEDGFAYVRVFADYGVGSYRLTIAGTIPASITGTVTSDSTGDPILGVAAQLITEREYSWGTEWEWAAGTETVADGTYRFDGVTPGVNYRLNFGAWQTPQYVSEWFDNVSDWSLAQAIQVEPGATFVADAQLADAATISGTVTDEDTGLPLKNAWVMAIIDTPDMSGYEWQNETETDASGHYTFGGLPAGTYKVVYSAEGYDSEWYDNAVDREHATVLDMSPGEATTADAALGFRDTEAVVAGTVIDQATGMPVRGVVVQVEAAGKGYGFSAYTGADGSYRLGPIDLSGYESADWRISFVDEMSGYLTEYFDNASSASEATLVKLTGGSIFDASAQLELKPNASTITGRITDSETGLPLPYAWVEATDRTMSGYDWDWDMWTQANADGYYQFRGVKPGHGYVIRASFETMLAEDSYVAEYWNNKASFDMADPISVELGGSRVVDFELSHPSELTGMVTADAGGPAKGVQVWLYDSSSTSGYLDMATTDADGSFTFGWLNPDVTYAVRFVDEERGRFEPEWYDDQQTMQDATAITLTPGDTTTISAGLAPSQSYGGISGTVSDSFSSAPVGGAQVDLYYSMWSSGYEYPEKYWMARTHTHPDGSYSFTGLIPSGEENQYYVEFSDPAGRYYRESFLGGSQIRVNAGQNAIADQALIDAQAPEVFSDQQDYYEGAAHITFSAMDVGSAGIDYISYYNGSDWVTVYGDTADVVVYGGGYHYISCYAVDRAGNLTYGPSGDIYISSDNQAPDTNAAVAPAAYIDGWRSAPTTVTLTATDNSDVVDITYYQIGDGAFSTYEAPFVVPQGQSTVHYYSVDAVGNEETPEQIIIKSDGDLPITAGAVTTQASVEREGVTYCSAPTTMTLDASDATSGVYRTYYRLGENDPIQYAGPFVMPAGTTEVTFWSVDKAGNRGADQVRVVNVDAAAPATVLDYPKASGKWASAPVSVTLSASDAMSGVDATEWKVDGDWQTYGDPFSVTQAAGIAGPVTVSYRSVDVFGNQEGEQSSQVWIDNAAPSAPGSLSYTALTSESVRLTWGASTDEGAGVYAYKIFKDGEYLKTVVGATMDQITGLTPGQKYEFSVKAVDGTGLVSASSAAFEVQTSTVQGSGSAAVGAGAAACTIPVNGAQAQVQFADVTTPGTVVVSVASLPPGAASEGFRFLGMNYDVTFSGSFSGNVTITLPYDPRIPDGRVRNAQVGHWVDGHWVKVEPVTVDTVNHTVTFTVSSLSPFALQESALAENTTALQLGFGSPTAVATRIVSYNGSSVLVGKLTATPGGEGLAGKAVTAEYYNTITKTWVALGTATARATAGEYQYPVTTKEKTSYRFHFAADPYNAESYSNTIVVLPKALFGKPAAPRTAYRYRGFKVTGKIYPPQPLGSTKTVYVKCYHYHNRKWRLEKTVAAKITASNSTYSTYTGVIKLSERGSWKVMAYTPTVGNHYTSKSVYSSTFTVR